MARVTEEHIEARKGQILDAAWACFSDKGYNQATMQDIATGAGISAGAIYRYFAGKEAILKAINQRSLSMGRTLVQEAGNLSNDPLGALQVIGRTMLSVFYDPSFESVARVNIEVWPELLRNADLRESFGNELAFWLTSVTSLLEEAKRSGQLRDDVEPEALAMVLVCAWEGMRHFRTITDTFKPESIVDVMRSLVSDESRQSALPSTEITHGSSPTAWPWGSRTTEGPDAKRVINP